MSIDLWGVKNIVDIALCGHQGNNEENKTYFICDINAFADLMGRVSVKGGDKRAPTLTGNANDDLRPVDGYQISISDLSKLNGSLTRYHASQHNQKAETTMTWSGKRWDGASVNDKCTQFYKTFWRDYTFIKDLGFRLFEDNASVEGSAKHWINVDLPSTDYCAFLMIWYRTADSYVSARKCGVLKNYRSDDKCKTLLDGVDAYRMKIADYCAGLSPSDPEIFSDECNNAFIKNYNASEISRKRVEYCQNPSKLRTDKNCLAIGNVAEPSNVMPEHKFLLDSYVRKNLCHSKMSQTNEGLLEFCSCIIEPRESQKIIDQNTGNELAPACYNTTCPDKGYHPVNKDNCPQTFCLQQTQFTNLLEAKNIQITCGASEETEETQGQGQKPEDNDSATTTKNIKIMLGVICVILFAFMFLGMNRSQQPMMYPPQMMDPSMMNQMMDPSMMNNQQMMYPQQAYV